MADAVQTAFAVYKNRSAIKRFLKWTLIIFCVFAFFVYMVVATVVAVLEGNIKPPKPTVAPTTSQSKPPATSKH